MVLEDESGRVALTGGKWHSGFIHGHSSRRQKRFKAEDGVTDHAYHDVPIGKIVDCLVTGVVIAVRGIVLPSGELAVNDICVPGLHSLSVSAQLSLIPQPTSSMTHRDFCSRCRLVNCQVSRHHRIF